MYGNATSRDSDSQRGTGAPRQIKRFFLKRLQQMVELRNERGRLRDGDAQELRLLDKAVYSTFCDCLDLDAGEEARDILHRGEIGTQDSAPREPDSN